MLKNIQFSVITRLQFGGFEHNHLGCYFEKYSYLLLCVLSGLKLSLLRQVKIGTAVKDDLRALIEFSLKIKQMLAQTESTKAKSYDPTVSLSDLITRGKESIHQ